MRVDPKLLDEHRFSTGVAHLRYRLPWQRSDSYL